MTASPYPPPECWRYWGGCDPTGVDAALREVAGLLGFGPSETLVGVALVALVAFPLAAVVYVDPLPETPRKVGVRVLLGLALVPAIGHGSRLAVDVGTAVGVSALWLVAAVVVAIVVGVVVVGVLRLRLLVANLRGESA